MTQKIKAENKRQWNKLIKEYRNKGYMRITYWNTLAELEKGIRLL